MADRVVVHVVDDEETVRSSLAFLLSASGWEVRTYASARAFLAKAPDLDGCLITDLHMPDMDGIGLLKELAAADAMLPTIVMTGDGEVRAAIEAIHAGALDFIEKPFSEEVVYGAISGVLQMTLNPIPSEEILRRVDGLDQLERRVLDLVADGHSSREIAAVVGTSVEAAATSATRVISKLQADGLPQLIHLLKSAGLTRQGR
jgi:two-component system response regulator FixJ